MEVFTEKEIKKEQLNLCYHCRQACEPIYYVVNDKVFCCEGCKLVFEILQENGLERYYELEKSPGINLKNKIQKDTYEFLDNPEILKKIINFESSDKYKVTLEIPSIHCASCVWLLENLYRLEPAILKADVNFLKKNAVFWVDKNKLSLRLLVERLSQLGYAPRFNLDMLQEVNKSENTNRKFLYQLGIAGFAFGNIMLLSFPEYFHLDIVIDASFRRFFGYLNFLLALPVVFFSSSGFFSSAIRGLRHGVVNIDVPLAIGIMVMFLRSSAEILMGTGAGFMDALAGLVFFLLAGRWFQNKSFDLLSFNRRFESYFPISVRKISDGKETPSTLKNLKPGDIVVLRNQELIPADGIVWEGEANIDYSFVTGESFPVSKKTGEEVFAGGRQIGSILKIILTKPVSQSYLTSLWNNPVFNKERSNFLSTRTNTVSKYFTIIILLIAGMGALFWLMVDPSKSWNVFTSVLIITCPCALALTIPFTFGNSLRIFGKNQFYLRNSDVIENLSKIDTVVFDKTGTLTTTKIHNIQYVGEDLNEEVLKILKSAVLSSTHPLSRALAEFLKADVSNEFVQVKEIPGKGINAGDLMLGSAEFVNYKEIKDNYREGSRVYVKWRQKLLGYFIIENAYRAGLGEWIRDLKSMDLNIIVLSGDSEWEKEKLSQLLGADIPLFFDKKPQDKMEFIKKIQYSGSRVLMIGDGLNDAGALKQADLGIAVTEEDSNFFPASDAMLKVGSFSKIGSLIRQAKDSMKTVKLSFFISFMYNITGLSFALRGDLQPVVAAVLMPLSSVSVIAFTVFTSTYFARKNKLI